MNPMLTLPAALDARAGSSHAMRFIFADDGGAEREWTLSRLRQRSLEIAAALREGGLGPGDRVALLLPEPEDFVPAFLGVMAAGGIPVPMSEPTGRGRLTGYLATATHILHVSGATTLLTTLGLSRVVSGLRGMCPALTTVHVAGTLAAPADGFTPDAPDLDDIAFLQFTSGSTSRPKGVCVSHRNLAENCRSIMEDGLRRTPSDRAVSWVPMFHDMGLIGFLAAPLLHPIDRVVLLSPRTFARRPASWLEAISRHQGTVTFAPNYAYALAARRVTGEELAGLDLSHLRVAGCGAEPIQAESLRTFAARLSGRGFREQAFVPGYGMAESTLAVSFGHGLRVDRVARGPLVERGLAIPAAEDDVAVELVSCGKAFPGSEIRIVDPETLQPLPERQVGEIAVGGPSVTSGYFHDEPATRRALWSGLLLSGDLGYLAKGELHVCGRSKDLIILQGRKYHPMDIERAVSAVEGVRAGNVIAFASTPPDGGEEAVVVVAEARKAAAAGELTARIRAAVDRELGLPVTDVVLLPPGGMPKTTSGKVQRSRTRDLYLRDELGRASLRQEGKMKLLVQEPVRDVPGPSLWLETDDAGRLWTQVWGSIQAYQANLPERPVANLSDPERIRRLLDLFELGQPHDPAELTSFVTHLLSRNQAHASHPRYFGPFNPAPSTMGVIADAIAAAFNPQLGVWRDSPAAVEIERKVLRWLASGFGYPALAEGTFTSGGAEANHTAILTALARAFPDLRDRGVQGLPGRPVLYTSTEAHPSLLKAARMCGLGSDALRSIPSDGRLRMNVAALASQIARDRAAGMIPFMVAATAGTAGAGVIDPLSEIAAVTEREGLWLHVDAAWGGAVSLVPQLRWLLDGIERADSIAFDADKWLSVPMGAGTYLTRHAGLLRHTFDADSGEPSDNHNQSMQWSRRFTGLKVFMSLAVSGADGYGRVITHQLQLGDYLRQRLIETGWRIMNDTPLPVVCFAEPDWRGREAEAAARAYRERVVGTGRAWISSAMLAGAHPVLRACITNHQTRHADVDELVATLESIRAPAQVRASG